MGSRFDIYGKPWVDFTAFADDHPKTPVAYFSMRLTKSGRVNLHDVNKWLRGGKFKVPIRYYDGGIRTLNPDVGLPSDVLREDTPEVYGWADVEFIDNLREQLLRFRAHEWEVAYESIARTPLL